MNQPNPNYHFNHAAVADALKCPVCRKHATSNRIYQCSSGHIICQSCQEEHQFTQCPSTCRRPIRDPLIRNLAMEQARHLILFPCTFSDAGCRRLFHPVEKAAHEADQCVFRSVNCFIKDCPWFRPLHELPGHLEAHIEVLEEPTGKFEFALGSLTELVAERKVETLVLLSDGQKKYMLWAGKLDPSPQSQQANTYAIGLIGLLPDHQREEEEAAGSVSFSYKLTLGNSTTALTKTFEGSPLSLNLLPQLNITEETRGMHFCDEATFQQLLDNDGLLHTKVSLIPIITLD